MIPTIKPQFRSFYPPKLRVGGLLLLLLIAAIPAHAQTVFENTKKEIYQFLSRQAQKGNIELLDVIQPYSRKDIAGHLQTLDSLKSKLTPIEVKELAFYHREYGEFNPMAVDETSFLKKDQHGRLRFLSVRKGDFLLNGDPTLIMTGIKGTGRSIFGIGTGLQFWGHAGKNIAFQAGYTDNTQTGDGIDFNRAFTPEMGIIKSSTTNTKSLNFSDFRGNITYSWSNGSITVGQDQLTYGYGENGRIIHSDKAPAYPFIRLDYRPVKWLSFNYSHAWLNSSVIDSLAIYNKGNTIYGDNRDLYVSKYMASHSLNFFPIKGLSLSIGESIVYSDKLEAGYLFPLMFFKIYDQHASRTNVPSGSNSQFFFQASSRNHIKNTHLYTTLFIDEIRTSTLFDAEKSRNQIGFNIGASVTDLGIKYLTLGAEYTRLNPFVYQNLIPAQNYSHHNYSMGDWMGANADRLMGYIKYTPIAKLKSTLLIQNTRKGDPGSLLDQYYAEPQPKFLDSYIFQQTTLQLKLSYEWLNNFYVEGMIQTQREKYISTIPDKTFKEARIGVRLGI